VRLTSFTHCANDAQVDLYEIIGEGHEWPGGKKLPAAFTAYLGPQSSAIDANAAMWSFFSRYTS
jgi:polyhydroxybutyrate depolymerase